MNAPASRQTPTPRLRRAMAYRRRCAEALGDKNRGDKRRHRCRQQHRLAGIFKTTYRWLRLGGATADMVDKQWRGHRLRAARKTRASRTRAASRHRQAAFGGWRAGIASCYQVVGNNACEQHRRVTPLGIGGSGAQGRGQNGVAARCRQIGLVATVLSRWRITLYKR